MTLAPEVLCVDSGLNAEWWGTCDYFAALSRMEALQHSLIEGRGENVVAYLEHLPVITYGRATPREDLPRVKFECPVVEVPRGGLATYHGPGQLVGYCIVNLRLQQGDSSPDIHSYIRALEQALIEFIRDTWELPAVRSLGRTGVWVHAHNGQLRKIASIGIHVRRWVTSHGFALNLASDLSMFRKIVPCGIRDAEMTSVERELRERGRLSEAQLVTQGDALRRIAKLFHPYLVTQFRAGGWLSEP